MMDGQFSVQENNFDLEKKGALAAKIIWLLLAVLFIFPLYKVTDALDDVYTLMGVNVTFGVKGNGYTVFYGSFVFGLLFLIPVIELIANFMLNNIYDVMKWNLIGSIVETVMILIYIIGLPLAYKVDNPYMTVEVLPVFYFMLLISILLIAMSVYVMNNMATPKKVDTTEDMCRKGGIFAVVWCISVVLIVLLIVNFKVIGLALVRLLYFGRII